MAKETTAAVTEVTEEEKKAKAPAKKTAAKKTATKKKAEAVSEADTAQTEDVEELSPEEAVSIAEDAEDVISESGPSIDEEIARKTSRFSYEVSKASKAEKKELYRSEHVITEYGEEDIETEAVQLRRDYLELVGSSKSGRILEGTIIGFRYASEPRKSTCLAEIEYGSGLCTVVIPSYVLYDYEASQYTDADRAQVIENNVIRRMGSKVKFIVRHVDEREMTAYADRLVAQAIIGHDNWIKTLRNGEPRITEGKIVQGQVVQVKSSVVLVDALGCEIVIPKNELMHAYVGDAREEFSVGDKVNVRVRNISHKIVEKNGTKYQLVQAEGSIKDATPNHKKKMYDQIKVGGLYSAEVTYIEEAGVYCRIRGSIDCLCALPRFGQNPHRGQKKIVKITEKNDERLYIFGVFVNN